MTPGVKVPCLGVYARGESEEMTSFMINATPFLVLG